MKVIAISSNNLELIDEVVTKAGHAVVAQTNDTAQLLALLTEHTPHVCLVEKPHQPDRQLNEAMASFTATRFVLLGYERGSRWTTTILNALAKGPIPVEWLPEEPEEQTIIADLRYLALSQAQELNRLISDQGGKTQLAIEGLRLISMLRTAATIGERAETYRDALAVINRTEWQEVAYCIGRGSYESVAFGRDLLARYAGYLGHFIPGADVDCFVPPVPQAADRRFLHFESPLELRYALFCLGLFGFNQKLGQPLLEMTRWRYEGGSSEELVRTSLETAGLVFQMEMVVLAHAVAINWLSDASALARLDHPLPRLIRRSLQIFRDFWGFQTVINLDNPTHLREVLRDCQSRPPHEALPDELRIPTFAEFHQTLRDFKNLRINSN